MGRLAGFRYREIIRRLEQQGFEFDRQAAGSHEIWFRGVPNVPGPSKAWRASRQAQASHFCE
jgi:hypothetical protein